MSLRHLVLLFGIALATDSDEVVMLQSATSPEGYTDQSVASDEVVVGQEQIKSSSELYFQGYEGLSCEGGDPDTDNAMKGSSQECMQRCYDLADGCTGFVRMNENAKAMVTGTCIFWTGRLSRPEETDIADRDCFKKLESPRARQLFTKKRVEVEQEMVAARQAQTAAAIGEVSAAAKAAMGRTVNRVVEKVQAVQEAESEKRRQEAMPPPPPSDLRVARQHIGGRDQRTEFRKETGLGDGGKDGTPKDEGEATTSSNRAPLSTRAATDDRARMFDTQTESSRPSVQVPTPRQRNEELKDPTPAEDETHATRGTPGSGK